MLVAVKEYIRVGPARAISLCKKIVRQGIPQREQAVIECKLAECERYVRLQTSGTLRGQTASRCDAVGGAQALREELQV